MKINIVETENKVNEYEFDCFIKILCDEYLKWKDKKEIQEGK